MKKKKTQSEQRKARSAQPHGSPSAALQSAARLSDALFSLTAQARTIDAEAVQIIGALTKCPKRFPKAALLGMVNTEIATLRVSGGAGSKPITIRTGADGEYAVYADNYQDGLPGRIIIEIAHPVKKENYQALPQGGAKKGNDEH